MVIEHDTMLLHCVRDVLHTSANDVYICRDENANTEVYYTLLVIKDHAIARALLEVLEYGKYGKKANVTVFSYKDYICLLFDYKRERSLNAFFMGSTFTLKHCESICMNLVTECMISPLPYQLLYLVLSQKLINLAKDDSVYFSYTMDLSDFDVRRNEGDCAVQCAMILQELLREHRSRKADSLELLNRKIPKEGYRTFAELYKDINLSAADGRKKGIIRRIRAFFRRNSKTIFKIFVVLCIALAVIALLALISQILLGNTSFFWIIFNPFKRIGTESMLQ